MSTGSFMLAAQEYEQTHTHAQIPRSQPRPIGDGTRRNSSPQIQSERQAKRPQEPQVEPEAKRPKVQAAKVQAARLVPLYQEGGYFNFNLSTSSVNGFYPRDKNDVELYDDSFEEAPVGGFPIKFQTDRSLKGKCKCGYVFATLFALLALGIFTYALAEIRESVNEIYASDKTLTVDNFPYEYIALIFIGVMALYCAIFTCALERLRPKSEYEVIQ